MAIYCRNCLGAMCDFCRHYQDYYDAEGTPEMQGYCAVQATVVDWEAGCPSFHCRQAVEGDAFSELQRASR